MGAHTGKLNQKQSPTIQKMVVVGDCFPVAYCLSFCPPDWKKPQGDGRARKQILQAINNFEKDILYEQP
jgi:hypothetical protein